MIETRPVNQRPEDAEVGVVGITPTPTTPLEPLWRDLLGSSLREHRTGQGRTLDEVATRAGVSPQYLSEIERGLKEPSSEIIAAVSGALGTTLLDLTLGVAHSLELLSVPTIRVCASSSVFALAA